MNNNEFSIKVANFLADFMATMSFNLDDTNQFFMFPTHIVMEGITYQIYNYKMLTAFTINCRVPDNIYFSFFVVKAAKNEKTSFLKEIQKQQMGQEYDAEIIKKYTEAFLPSKVDYKNLTSQLKSILEDKIYSGKGFNFSPLFTSPNKDIDHVIVFIEDNSFKTVFSKITPEMAFEPSM